MKQKVVLLKADYGTITPVIDDGELNYWHDNGYVVISKTVEIDFPELPEDRVISNQIKVIDKKITAIQAEAEANITQLKARKQELLAITHEGE